LIRYSSIFRKRGPYELFGVHGTENERPESDVDIPLLLPPEKVMQKGALALSGTWFEPESILGNTVDLANVRLAPAVLQKEVITEDRRIYTGDENAAEEFEMMTISLYQKLDISVMTGIIDGRLDDLPEYTDDIVTAFMN